MPTDRRRLDDDRPFSGQFEKVPYGQVVKEGSKGIMSVGALAALAALVVAVIGGAAWWISVAASPVTGAAKVYKDQNAAGNREAAQTRLVGDYNIIRADQANIRTLAASSLQIDKDSLAGTEQVCNGDVAQYDTDANALLSAPWVPAGWPKTISQVQSDSSDPCNPASAPLPILVTK